MADESYPEDLKYFKEHDWVRVEGDEATFGITWWAQDALGDMVYASLPDVGAAVTAGQPYGELESVKSVAEIYAPVGGEVVAANEALVGRSRAGQRRSLRRGLADPRAADRAVRARRAHGRRRLPGVPRHGRVVGRAVASRMR